jgi:hypothetical protein
MHPNSFNSQKTTNGANPAQAATSVPASSAPLQADPNSVQPFGSIDEPDVGLHTFTEFLFEDADSLDSNVPTYYENTQPHDKASSSSYGDMFSKGNKSRSANTFEDIFSPWLEDSAFEDYPVSEALASQEVASTGGSFAPYNEAASQGCLTHSDLGCLSVVETPSFGEAQTPFDGGTMPSQMQDFTQFPSSPFFSFDHPEDFSHIPKGHFD